MRFSAAALRLVSLVAVIGASTPFLAMPVKAMGFTNDFAPTNWKFYIDEELVGSTPICADDSCVEIDGNNATIINTPPLGDDRPSTVRWSWTNEYQPIYYISFVYSFLPLQTNDTATYQIGNLSPILISSGDQDLQVDPQLVSFGQSISFTVNRTQGDTAALDITQFNTAVPSPLPVAGLGLAALGIYRAGRRKSRATPK